MTSLDTSAEAMWEELEASRRKVERMFGELDEMLRRYHGFYFDPGASQKREVENPAFEALAVMSSQLVSGDPYYMVEPQRSDDPMIDQRCIGLEYAGNKLVRGINLKRTFRRGLVDYFFRRAVFLNEREALPYVDRGPVDGVPHRANVRLVPMKWFRYDARATDMQETRWRAHPTITSKGSLLERIRAKDGKTTEQGWRVDLIEGLQPEDDLCKMISKDGESLKRDDFILWNVWIPDEQVDEELTPDKGYWGAWHYYAQIGKGVSARGSKSKRAPLVEIREPQACFSARQGPYTIVGQYDVPNESESLTMFLANEEWARQTSDTSRVLLNLIREYKNIMVYSGADQALAGKIKNAKNGSSFYSKGFDPKFAQTYTMGGLDANMLGALDWMLSRSKERTGITDSMLGQAASGATATAETLAAGGASSRIAFLRDTFYDGLAQVGRGLFEMIDGDEDFYMRVPTRVQEQMGFRYDMVKGGRENGQTFDDYDVVLQPLMMRHKTAEETAMEADQEFTFWQAFTAMAPTAPYLNLKDVIRDRARLTQRPNLDARVNYELLNQMQGLALAGQVQTMGTGSQTSDRTPKPTTARKPVSSVGGSSQQKPAMARGSSTTIGDKAGRAAAATAKTGKVK